MQNSCGGRMQFVNLVFAPTSINPIRLESSWLLAEKVTVLQEFNLMLGYRGCRLGISYPEITEMQARAIFEAACELRKLGKNPFPEVMIPLVGSQEELRAQ